MGLKYNQGVVGYSHDACVSIAPVSSIYTSTVVGFHLTFSENSLVLFIPVIFFSFLPCSPFSYPNLSFLITQLIFLGLFLFCVHWNFACMYVCVGVPDTLNLEL